MAVVYLNGEFVPEQQAQVSVYDRAFLFGDAVYEVIPVFAGRCFCVDEHLQRLESSLAAVSIGNPHNAAGWKAIFASLIERNGGGDQKLYLQISRGAAGVRDHRFPVGVPPTVLVMSAPLPNSGTVNLADKGISVILRHDNRWQRCNIKSTSLLANVLLGQQAVAAGAAETLLERDGKLTEGASSNVFVVLDGVIRTAAKGPEILGGITRDLLTDLIQAAGLPFLEQAIDVQQLPQVEEIWISSSTREIVPVVELDGQPVGKGEQKGRVGLVTATVAALYADFKKDFLIAG